MSPEAAEGPELLLEPNAHPAAATYQHAIFSQGIPAAMFSVSNVESEYKRLKDQGVKFTKEPANIGPATIAILEDTCGNLIQLAQFHG